MTGASLPVHAGLSNGDSSAAPPKCEFEFLSLKGRLARARRDAFAANDPGFRELELGACALRDARQLADGRAGDASALLLYRSAIRLFVFAWLLRRRGPTLDAPASDIWRAAEMLPAWPAQGERPEWLERGIVLEAGETYLATLTGPRRARALVEMRAMAEALEAPLARDALLVPRLLWTRRLRVVLALLPVALLLVWGATVATRKPNLALHRAVSVSDWDPGLGVDPERVVDGDRMNLGFHTTARAGSFVTIDLGALKSISRVDVYNRADCCQDRIGPLSLQLSTDGETFTQVAHRIGTFIEWTARLPSGTKARSVRIVHETADYFHLSEVEVY